MSLVFALLSLVGCHASSKRAEGSLPLAQIDPTTAGSISGKVSLTGVPPVMPVIDMSANPNCERQHHTPQRSEQVVVNGDGTLRYVFVWVKDGLPKARWTPPSTSAKLDQEGCVYRPHVLGVMTNQEIEIDNSDPVNHNVHAESSVNPPWNESQPPRAEKKFKRFALQEVMFPMTCSVHPWMRSYIAVVAHPFFAVTGTDGAFSLQGLPPGSYTLEAIHEKLGKKEMKVNVAAHESTAVAVAFQG